MAPIQRSTTFVQIDLELQHNPPSKWSDSGDKDSAIHIAAMQKLFGCPSEALHEWPGLRGYCQYLEECFHPLLADHYDCIWKAIGIPRPKKPVDCWPWANALNETIRTAEERGTTADVLGALRSSFLDSRSHAPSQNDTAICMTATFAVLCWSSMTLKPMLPTSDASANALEARRTSDRESMSLKPDAVRRPICAAFRSFQRNMCGRRWRQPICDVAAEHSSVLHVSTLNFQSLQTIGKIRLSWVGDLSSHLDYEPRTRTLSVFQFPTFCALTTLVKNRGVILEGIARSLYSADLEPEQDFEYNVQLSQEILMSYRVLFGQTAGSRKRARDLIQKAKREPCYDELLDLVCCQSSKPLRKLPASLWPISCRSIAEDTLQEEDTYSSQDDFPLLGQRLKKLQDFNLRQQPSRLRDLWRDRRSPLTWYTFWVVLIFGSVSILITFLQLIVAIIAIPTAPTNGCHSLDVDEETDRLMDL
ncbi:MAG: hypothetical protein Q9163_000938 [Psora crenata]